MRSGQTPVCQLAMTRLKMLVKVLTSTSKKPTRLPLTKMRRSRSTSRRLRKPRRRWILILAPVSGVHGQTGQIAPKLVNLDLATGTGRLKRKPSTMGQNAKEKI